MISSLHHSLVISGNISTLSSTIKMLAFQPKEMASGQSNTEYVTKTPSEQAREMSLLPAPVSQRSIFNLFIWKTHVSNSFLKSQHMPARISRDFYSLAISLNGMQNSKLKGYNLLVFPIFIFIQYQETYFLFLQCQLVSGNKGEYGVTLGAFSNLGCDVLFAVCIVGVFPV